MESLDAVARASLARSPANEMGSWASKEFVPPPDIAIGTSGGGRLTRAAREIGEHVIGELDRGRSLYHSDHAGHVLPLYCLERATS